MLDDAQFLRRVPRPSVLEGWDAVRDRRTGTLQRRIVRRGSSVYGVLSVSPETPPLQTAQGWGTLRRGMISEVTTKGV